MAQPNVEALFTDFDNDLLEQEWNEVATDYPTIADHIQRLVSAGVKPSDISKRVIRLIGNTRTGMARRLENAAQYWHNQRHSNGVTVAGGR